MNIYIHPHLICCRCSARRVKPSRPGLLRPNSRTTGGLYGDHLDPWLPSGKQPHNYGKSPFFMGKSTISTGPFSIANC